MATALVLQGFQSFHLISQMYVYIDTVRSCMITLFMLKIGMSLMAILILSIGMFGILRMFDKMLGIDFKEAFNKIEESPYAMAHYFAMRQLGAYIAIGLIICTCFVL